MADFRLMAIDLISADKVIDDGEVRILRKHLYADNRITHDELQFLMDLRKKVKTASVPFDKFYLKAAGDSILDHNIVSAEELVLLKTILADKKLDVAEAKKFLNRIQKEALPNPAFDKLHNAYLAKHK